MSKLQSFAHFLGLATGAARAAEDDEDKPKGKRAEGPMEDDPAEEENAKGKRADGDDDLDPDAEDEDDEDKEPKGKKAKGKRAEKDDDQDDADAEDEDDDKKATKAVRADRQRSAAIMAYGVAHGCAEQAGALAFDSNVSRATAINVMKAGAGSAGKKSSASRIDQRMSAIKVHQVGPDASQDLPAGVSAIAAGIIKAGQ